MKKITKRIGIVIAALILLLVLAVGSYVLYMTLQYSRIADNETLAVANPQSENLSLEKSYTALTYNIGFGAYNHDFSFFMDSGKMKDGTPVSGKNARAQSKSIVMDNTTGALNAVKKETPDFILLQEVDTDATRSFHLNQVDAALATFPDYASTFASNFHSAFLAYPFHEPHGSVEAGLLTLSRYNIASAVRRSYPVDNSFPTKFFDLDRCFSMQRFAVDKTDKELVLINSHMSAYDKGGTVREQQLLLLNTLLADERAKGNYVIVGGDFNHALCGTETAFASEQEIPAWVFTLQDSQLAEGFSIVKAENVTAVPTCRSTDMPYQKGINYTSVLDGFIISDNVKAIAKNIDLDFLYSDHNPVLLQFELLA